MPYPPRPDGAPTSGIQKRGSSKTADSAFAQTAAVRLEGNQLAEESVIGGRRLDRRKPLQLRLELGDTARRRKLEQARIDGVGVPLVRLPVMPQRLDGQLSDQAAHLVIRSGVPQLRHPLTTGR